MSAIKTFKIEITEIGGDVSSSVEMSGFTTLEILGIRSILDGMVKDALEEADEVENEDKTKNETL
jgi:hypothetical protein